MTLVIDQFICREDNFGVLLHDAETNRTAAIDAPDEGAVRAHLDRHGWRLDEIFTTHHHVDHVESNLALKAAYGCRITGPAGEADKIPGIDRAIKGGDAFTFGGETVNVIDTPGHTIGHVSYWLPETGAVFTADALFSLGCGRIFEGTAEMLWTSLTRLAALPGETRVYCGHEYTLSNGRFALTIEPDNAALVARVAEVERLRAEGKPTLPTTIALEKRTNPFLRADEPGIRARLGMAGAGAAAVFGEIRRRKDTFS